MNFLRKLCRPPLHPRNWERDRKKDLRSFKQKKSAGLHLQRGRGNQFLEIVYMSGFSSFLLGFYSSESCTIFYRRKKVFPKSITIVLQERQGGTPGGKPPVGFVL